MELKGSRTEANLHAAFAGESQARNKYTYFASKARKDGYVQIAKIFEETAGNEKEHAELWYKLAVGIGTTEENLLAAAEGEHGEWTEMYPQFADIADEEGFPVVLCGCGAGVEYRDPFPRERVVFPAVSCRRILFCPETVLSAGEETFVATGGLCIVSAPAATAFCDPEYGEPGTLLRSFQCGPGGIDHREQSGSAAGRLESPLSGRVPSVDGGRENVSGAETDP